MNLSNLPPVGTPEYWRAIRQLATRAKVDIDRLWGRVAQSLNSWGGAANPLDVGVPAPDCMRDVVYIRSWRIEIPSEISFNTSNPGVFCTIDAGVYYVPANGYVTNPNSCPPGTGNASSTFNLDTNMDSDPHYYGQHPSTFFSSAGIGDYEIATSHSYRTQSQGGGLPDIITGFQLTSFIVNASYLSPPNSIVMSIRYSLCYQCTRDVPLSLPVFSISPGITAPSHVILTPSRRLVTEW